MNFAGAVDGVPDATIRQVESLPEHLEGAIQFAPHAQALPGALLLDIPGVARFLVRDGVTIDVAIARGASPWDVRIYLHGSVRSALIHQRGEMPLHAASLMPPDAQGAIAICGPSGAGKSTLALELTLRGWKLVADDMTRITVNEGRATAWPTAGSIKLWRDTCDAKGIFTAPLQRVRAGLEKLFVPVAGVCGPVPVTAIVALRLAEAAGLHTLPMPETLALLSENCCRPRQIRPLGRLAEHLAIVARVASACPVAELRGARDAPVEVLADMVAGLVE